MFLSPIKQQFSSLKSKSLKFLLNYWKYLKKEYLSFIFIILFLVFGIICDQVIKSSIFLTRTEGWKAHSDRSSGFWYFLDLGYAKNVGLAGGILSNFGIGVYIVIFLIVIFFFFAFIFSKDFNYKLACGMIFIGGFSNLLDRFLYNGVVDYIEMFNLNRGYFNIGDTFIILGLAYFLINLIFDLSTSPEAEYELKSKKVLKAKGIRN